MSASVFLDVVVIMSGLAMAIVALIVSYIVAEFEWEFSVFCIL